MTEEQIKDAALAYMKRALGKECHYLDSSSSDDEWVVRVVVVEPKDRKSPGSGPKRWQVLYEVHLGPGGEPLYQVKKGLWNKDLPTATPASLAKPEAVPAPAIEAPAPATIPATIEEQADAGLREIDIKVEAGEAETTDDMPPPEATTPGEEPPAARETEAAVEEPAAAPLESPPGDPESVTTPPGQKDLGERQGPPKLTFRYEATEDEETSR